MREYVNAIELSGVSKKYQDFSMKNIDLALPKGYIMGLIGENGAGKTTLLKMISGAVKQDEGSVYILGYPVNERSDRLCEHIGVVTEECTLPSEHTPEKIGKTMSYIYQSWDGSRFEKYTKRFGIPAVKKIKELSKGMKMKLSIAVSLSHDVRLLILDEATSGLDPVAREEILDIFMEFIQNEECSILISSHILSDLEKICDYITYIKNGRIIFSEIKDELLEKYCIFRCSREEAESFDKNAVVSRSDNMFGAELLLDRTKIDVDIPAGNVSIEEIMVHMAKEEKK